MERELDDLEKMQENRLESLGLREALGNLWRRPDIHRPFLLVLGNITLVLWTGQVIMMIMMILIIMMIVMYVSSPLSPMLWRCSTRLGWREATTWLPS